MTEEYIRNLFNSNKEILFLPVEVSSGNEVYPTLFALWQEYIKFLKHTPELSDCVSEAEFQINNLKTCIESYFSGNFYAADEAIKAILIRINRRKNSSISTNLFDLYIDNESHQCFRARQGASTANFKRKDMKHVPYSLREKVGNTRYSISGIPCLYLGNSIYVCYCEAGKPNKEQIWVCRYVPRKSLRVLNLSTTAFELVNSTTFIKGLANNSFTEDKYKSIVKEYFSNWILQSACSVHVKREKEVPFKEEYIIPQRLMCMIKQFGIDGIMYFTVRDRGSFVSHLSWISKNIAIPAFDSINEAYSKKIDQMFMMSEPLCFEDFKNGCAGTLKECSPLNPNWARTNEPVIINGECTRYSCTDYYRAEIELMQSEYWEENDREIIQKIFPVEYKHK